MKVNLSAVSHGACVVMMLAASAPAIAQEARSLPAGETWTVSETARLGQLRIAQGGQIAAPAGQQLTLTVDGVETPIRPGAYAGQVVVTPTAPNPVDFSFAGTTITHQFRQALYVDAKGIDHARSVESAAGHYVMDGNVIRDITVRSVGENFNGVFIGGGDYIVRNLAIDLSGNGVDDFAGVGAGFMVTGKDTRVTLDGAHITAHGAVRSGIVVTNGANFVAKNVTVATWDGPLPAGYVENVDPGKMLSVPWMLGLKGTNRATNLLGEKSRATYINSDISSENWGVLSNDISDRATLTAINTRATTRGKSGYGTYSLGGATSQFYGAELNVADYAVIVDVGGSVVRFGASRPDVVARLNQDLSLGLSPADMKAIAPRQTVVNSGRFGLFLSPSPVLPPEMAARPAALVDIRDGTVFNTREAVFISKGLPANIMVDGAGGARLNPANGVIMQVIEADDPGITPTPQGMLSNKVYHEPKGPPLRAQGFDLTGSTKEDIHATFANIALKGNFYNGFRDGTGGFNQGKAPSGKNLLLTFDHASLTGTITATTAHHRVDTIDQHNNQELGEVTNVPGVAVNNGVVVTLKQASWTVTGTSYLTALSFDAASHIAGPKGARVVLKVNQRVVPLKPGQYKGDISLSLTR